jgi:hypothetical protein
LTETEKEILHKKLVYIERERDISVSVQGGWAEGMKRTRRKKKKVGGCPGFDTRRRSQRQSHGEKKEMHRPIQTISTFLPTFL